VWRGYGIVEDEPREYGTCDFEIGEEPKVAEPAEAVREDAARIWLYMAETHGVALTVEERAMFERWAEADPVSNWERERDELIEGQQGPEPSCSPLIQQASSKAAKAAKRLMGTFEAVHCRKNYGLEKQSRSPQALPCFNNASIRSSRS